MKTIIYFIIVISSAFLNKLHAQAVSVINVEIDYMADGTHSHRPAQAEIDAVVQMFACHGITLNVVIDDQIPESKVLRRNPDPQKKNDFFGYSNGLDTYGGIKAVYFDHGAGWHYCIFGHQYQDLSYVASGSSGLGEIKGDDFIVTLGAFNSQIGTPWDRASSFAHELGHNLGLSHSGGMDESAVGPNTPNLPSIMSYFYQLAGVRNNMEFQGLVPQGLTLYKNLDYSNGRACTVDEHALNEAFGIGIMPVDWDCDKKNSGKIVPHDISNNSNYVSGWCGAIGALDILSDYDEWSHIADYTNSNLKSAVIPKEISCITYDEYKNYIASAKADFAQPIVVNENCTLNQMYYVSSSGVGYVEGSCSLPLANIGIANLLAKDGDIIYMLPGTHLIGTPPLIISKQVIIGGSGNADIGR